VAIIPVHLLNSALRHFNASPLQRFNALTLQRFNASTLQRFRFRIPYLTIRNFLVRLNFLSFSQLAG